MLKLMQGNKFFTVFLLSAITIMISVAFIFWGIGPKDNPSVSFVAQIENEKITLDQYWRAYDNEYKRLRDQNTPPEDIEKLDLEERILSSLVNRRVLLIAAERAGIKVTERDLQDVIKSTPYFQRDGVFDQNVYERALKLGRISPQAYENGVRDDIIVNRMHRMIGETSELTAEELKILESMKAENKEQLRSVFLSSRSNQTVQAYLDSFKRQLDIRINRELIS